ncbi:MAG: hypothetical protein ACOCYU_05230 [Brevefilum sp.]
MPEINRFAVVSAVIMLAFALTQLISFPARLLSFVVLGIQLNFTLDFNTVITLLTAALSAIGMDWLLLSHPDRDQYQSRWSFVRHWIMPVLTSLVIGIALNTFAGEPLWWVVFLLGSLLLMAVLVAEYNVVPSEDIRHPLARIGLTALSFALFLLLSIALYSADLRLYLRLPILGVGALMVISRSIYLRVGRWEVLWSFANSLILAEIAVGFHYLPIPPIQIGLYLVGIAYGLTSIVTAIKEGRERWAFWGEPIVMIALVVLISLIWI